MKPNNRYCNMPKMFWAHVRLISQKIGYSERGQGRVKAPSNEDIKRAFVELGFKVDHLFKENGEPEKICIDLVAYFKSRASVLNEVAQHLLMDSAQAESLFFKHKERLKPKCPLPMNKQKGDKKNYAYLTGLVNMMIEEHSGEVGCDYDPRELTVILKDDVPLRTMSRRVDGCFPSVKNPIALWEIKEYYYTTTFGSRVAGGVYESILDGMELDEFYCSEGINTKHYLIIDAKYTWWNKGKSYLCRLYDIMHMGYVDEVIIGSEVVERIPELMKDWLKTRNE